MDELQKNIAAYEKMEKDLLETSYGKIALFSNGKLIDVYNDLADAYKVGLKYHGEGKFSIKKINTKVEHLGIRSYSLRPKNAAA
ncbi:MAG: hypothetical protein K8953_09670 [Proteobacteria bacterium]|nr:hypothetical protein [Pseudomonadota bacterium]